MRRGAFAGACGCKQGSVRLRLREMQGCEAAAFVAVVALAVRGLRECVARMPPSTSFDCLTKGSYGREKGILAGANVVMPNLSPVDVRKKYELYDNKICTGDEAAECRNCMSRRMESIGYKVVTSRGDFKNPEK